MDIYLIEVCAVDESHSAQFFVLGNGRDECALFAYGAYAKQFAPEAYVRETKLVGRTVRGFYFRRCV
jgi:hypothetical protein